MIKLCYYFGNKWGALSQYVPRQNLIISIAFVALLKWKSVCGTEGDRANKLVAAFALSQVSTSCAVLRSAVHWCLSMWGATGENGNLCCIVQLCARTNVIRLLFLLQKKICFCAHFVGTEIDWIQIAIFWRKIFRKKKHKVPWKRCHWATPLFKSRDDIFAEHCALFFFFKIFWGKIFRKKRKIPQ